MNSKQIAWEADVAGTVTQNGLDVKYSIKIAGNIQTHSQDWDCDYEPTETASVMHPLVQSHSVLKKTKRM